MTVAHARFLFSISPKTSGKLPSLSASCRSSSWGSSRIHLPKGAVPFWAASCTTGGSMAATTAAFSGDEFWHTLWHDHRERSHGAL